MSGSEKANKYSTLSLVVPMYNEEDRVGESLDPLLQFIGTRPPGSRILFVDDGSTDATVAVVERRLEQADGARAEILSQPHAGKGAAVRFGLMQASTDLAAFCDVDLATPLEELDAIIEAAASRPCLAIGSRAVDGAVIEQHEVRRRELAGRAFNRLVRNSLCGGVKDTQCGAKAAATPIWRSILSHSREGGFAWDVEVIALSLRLDIPVSEIGITWNHDERTRVRVLHDGMAMVFSVPRIWRHVRHAHAGPELIPDAAAATA